MQCTVVLCSCVCAGRGTLKGDEVEGRSSYASSRTGRGGKGAGNKPVELPPGGVAAARHPTACLMVATAHHCRQAQRLSGAWLGQAVIAQSVWYTRINEPGPAASESCQQLAVWLPYSVQAVLAIHSNDATQVELFPLMS